MPGVSKTREEKPKPYSSSMRLPVRPQPRTTNLMVRNHRPGENFFYDYCACQDCRTAFVTKPAAEVAALVASRPMYRYKCFVNALKREERQDKLRAERKAAAKREEDHQEKLRAEREAAAAAVEASKKDKASKDQPKND